MNFLALFVTLPTQQSAGRMRVWRALKALGCATLRDGVYLLPESERHFVALMQIADDVKSVQGSADLFLLSARNEGQQRQLVAQFDRGEDYARLLAAIAAAASGDAKVVRSLRRELSALSAIDYFPGEARRQAEEALAALEAAASGEPHSVAGKIRRLESADFQGRTWATRQHLWVDRMASAWLIRRFIDKKASFLWLDDPQRCPQQALGFDFDGASFTHVDGRVTFEVLAASFGLDADAAIARIASIVHCLDAGGVPVAEAAGIEAVLAGARAAAPNDDKLLIEASRLFDNLYKNFQQENSHE
ncbi:MAG: chromate resistance protein [Rhodocyclales bacterium]|nr:chromate resistance protein [Rhodocyclales bacterium]